MLARVVARPAATIRRGSQLQRRFIHPSRSQLQAFSRPNTLLAKICLRADGKPRSMRLALHFGSLILLSLYLLSSIPDLIKYRMDMDGLLSSVILFQRVDLAYDSVNFDDPVSNLSYFKKLFQCLTRDSEEKVDKAFKELFDVYKSLNNLKMGSTNCAEVEAYKIMRSTAEKVHGAFRKQINPDSYLPTAEFVVLVMNGAVECFVDLMLEGSGVYSRYNMKLMREKKDGLRKDYELIG